MEISFILVSDLLKRNFLGAVLAAPTLFSHPLLLRWRLRLPSQERRWAGDLKGASALRVGNARAWNPVVDTYAKAYVKQPGSCLHRHAQRQGNHFFHLKKKSNTISKVFRRILPEIEK